MSREWVIFVVRVGAGLRWLVVRVRSRKEGNSGAKLALIECRRDLTATI